MNERIFKNVKRILAGFGACLLSFSFLFVPVLAYGSNVEPLICETPVTLASSSVYVNYSNSYRYVRYRIASTNGSVPTISDANLSGVSVSFLYFLSSDGHRQLIVFYDASSSFISGNSLYVCLDYSADGVIWTQGSYSSVSNSYTYNGSGYVGDTLNYHNFNRTGNRYLWFDNINKIQNYDIPVVSYNSQVTYPQTVLAVISGNIAEPWPWDFSSSSGGRHWSDGTTLDSEDVSKYSQIFIVMDSNDDNSVTQEEINYYNYTYNTNYDYSQVNQNQNFDEDEFLYYIATEINNGNDNPGGGTGTGGGSGSVGGGGVTVTDSFTQSQTQSIAENAVNVSITNNNSFDPENVNNLNSLINNNIGNQEGTNAVTEAVYNINLMTSLARKISSLIGIILGFLPWWASTIVGLMFSILAVMVVFRLIHLFI